MKISKKEKEYEAMSEEEQTELIGNLIEKQQEQLKKLERDVQELKLKEKYKICLSLKQFDKAKKYLKQMRDLENE